MSKKSFFSSAIIISLLSITFFFQNCGSNLDYSQIETTESSIGQISPPPSDNSDSGDTDPGAPAPPAEPNDPSPSDPSDPPPTDPGDTAPQSGWYTVDPATSYGRYGQSSGSWVNEKFPSDNITGIRVKNNDGSYTFSYGLYLDPDRNRCVTESTKLTYSGFKAVPECGGATLEVYIEVPSP